MSLLRSAPSLTVADAVRLACDAYGVRGTAHPLPSERDQNFVIESGSGRFVLKIANRAESRFILEAQNAVLAHLERRVPFCPRVVPTQAGEEIAHDSGYYVRLVTWLPGVPFGTLREHPDALLVDLGRCLGELDLALADFDHGALHREFHWDLARAIDIVSAALADVPDLELRRAIAHDLMSVAGRLQPRVDRLRRSIAHNDPNDYNVLVGSGSSAADRRISGLIDFGDMVHTFTIADLAVAAAYAVLGKPDPLAAAIHLVRGYDAVLPLTEDECAVLFDLLKLRLYLSVAHAIDQQRQRPGDDYLTISQAAIRQTLPSLWSIDPHAAEVSIRTACAVGGPSARKPPARGFRNERPHLGPNLRLSYRDPVRLVRGSMQYLYDAAGRRFLDAYNNVPHVGHCHPRVVEAAATQLRTLNTNTRYLDDALERFAASLTATLPAELCVCYLVNSGSEANELALRLARAHTKRRDVVVLESAYHGITTTLIDISPYKFNGPGGTGKPSWVHVAPLPDVYRGRYRADDPDACLKYADAVGEILDGAARSNSHIGAFIAESAPSVGGQIMLPPGYLQRVYSHVRSHGAVCIADEVQTAYGRIGSHFYAFEAQGVVPDVVVLGKPIGNGYPLGAVITTREIAASFDNGMEFFSTFGGGTVACAIGAAVLDVVQREGLQEHARHVGTALIAGLRGLAHRHPLVGDVRGSGLFLGIELVTNRESKAPASREASDVVNRMREQHVLIGTDGPDHNVLKIRPPMPFDSSDAAHLLETLDRVLSGLTGAG